MNKLTLTILTILILTLTACSASNAPQVDAGQSNDSFENALPLSTQLLVGTFKLEGTALAVTPQQAAKLIPLWQVMQSLSASDSVAQEETDALFNQIQETMTPEQLQAINDMQLTRQDMFATLQEQGIADAGDPRNADSSTPHPGGEEGGQGGDGFNGPGGGHGGEGGEGGPGGGGQGLGLSPDQIATAQASGVVERRGEAIPPVLVQALIEFLQQKAGS